MTAPNYEQIQSFNNVSNQLKQAAIEEFMEYVYDGMTADEVIDAASNVAYKYSILGEELGAQWYDLCTELAGIDAEDAYLPEVDESDIRARAKTAAKSQGSIQAIFDEFLQNQINESIRTTGTANMWRDYERGIAPGKWARVPVGDTCAWCLMLASQGAWYLTEKSALTSKHGGNYHRNCNCVAVYHAEPDEIGGYSKLKQYKQMYYDADNVRLRNARGIEEYPEELAQRVAAAKAEHKAQLDAGLTDVPWQAANETAIVMRYQHPGMH